MTEEYQRKQEKGLCFRCDEKFTPSHRCKNKQLNVFSISEEVEDEFEPSESDMLSEEERNEDAMTLSLNAMVGITDAKSMRLKGIVQGHEIMILIDCGATHNFVSHEVVKALGIRMDKGKRFTVQEGDGYELQSTGIFRGVQVELQGISHLTRFLPTPIV